MGEILCVNDDGFVPCGDPPLPGVTCAGGVCCQNPRRCCEVAGEVACCVFGEGEPLELRPEVSFEGELVMGVPGVSIEVEFGVDFGDPSMEFEGVTEQPEESVTMELSGPEESPGESPGESPEDQLDEAEESGGPGVSEEPEASEGPEVSVSVEVSGSELDAAEDDGSVCFAGDAIVEVHGEGKREMREVKVGDRVRVGEDAWEEVMMWSHWDAAYEGQRYVRVRLEGGAGVKTSEGHVVWVWECEEGCERRGMRVEKVRVGMWMWVVGEGMRRVVGVEQAVWGRGLFNPQTASGGIVVDGVWVTCYTKWVPVGLAHGLLAPVRALWAVAS